MEAWCSAAAACRIILFLDLEEAQGQGNEHSGENQQKVQIGPDDLYAIAEKNDLLINLIFGFWRPASFVPLLHQFYTLYCSRGIKNARRFFSLEVDRARRFAKDFLALGRSKPRVQAFH